MNNREQTMKESVGTSLSGWSHILFQFLALICTTLVISVAVGAGLFISVFRAIARYSVHGLGYALGVLTMIELWGYFDLGFIL